MGGYSGTRTSLHTPIVKLCGTTLAVSDAQRRLIERAIRAGGSLHVKGGEVRTARALHLFGELHDDGALSASGEGNPDGERWSFTIREGVEIA